MDMSWLCYPVGGPDYLYLPVPGAQNCSLMPWRAIKLVALIFGVSVSPVQSTACWASVVLTWPLMVCDTAVSKCSLAQAGFGVSRQPRLKWVPRLFTSPAAVLECMEVVKSVGTFQKHSFSWVFPGACSDTRIVSSCVLLSPCCYHTNLVMSWLPALCRNCSMHCWGSYFHVGPAFPATLTPRTQLLSDRVARRGMIFFMVPGPSIYTFGVSWCAEHPDANSLTPTAQSNILKAAQWTTVT